MYRVIAGGTGLIGKRLVEHWLKKGHTITVIGRSEKHIQTVFGDRVKAVGWGKLTLEALRGAEVVVNLTGENISGKPWSDKRKHEIINSRVGSTKKLVGLLSELTDGSPRLLNASAIGIYGLQPQTETPPPGLDESAPIQWEHPKDFLSQVGVRWEKAVEPAVQKGIPVTLMRFGVVLAKEGGALPVLKKPFQFFLGSVLGTGKQPFCWVAMDDVIRAIDFLVDNPELTGPVNIVSPQCVPQAEFAKTLARVMNKPCFLKIPASLISTMLGQMGRELVLDGQHVVPKRLTDRGFKFLYGDLETALNRIIV